MTTDQILLGVALILVLAVASQVLAIRLRVPALIILLPVGFIAGAATDLANPDMLLGAAFEPLVTLAVAVILYDAGLGLDLRRLHGHTRRTVVRLVSIGTALTWAFGAAGAALLLGMSAQAAVMLGAILVVSGPTVVSPLLRYIRPTDRLQRVLIWEGSLIDPVGAVLGALVFGAISASAEPHLGAMLLHFLGSILVGAVGGAAGAVTIWALLRGWELPETLATSAQLAVVVGVAAVCDTLRADSGLTAAIVMGLAVANLRSIDTPARRPFFETLVQLIIGVLFVAISATITPASLRGLVLPAFGLVALLVLAARPLVAWLCTTGTDLTTGERLFAGWMAPRGIVAAATASTFAATLVSRGVPEAEKILPATFLVIVGTVTLYGLTAPLVARRLGATRSARSRPLLVGGRPWVIALGAALGAAGLEVLMWASRDDQRARIRDAGLELAPGELLAAATGRGAQIEGITTVLLLTVEDDFNALASTLLLDGVDGSVHRLRPPLAEHGVVAPYTGAELLFDAGLTRVELARRFDEGARILTRPGGRAVADGHDVLFTVRANGQLLPSTGTGPAPALPGDTLVLIGPGPADAPQR